MARLAPLLVAANAAVATAATPPWHRGIVFGLDEWSAPGIAASSATAQASLLALRETGATHVRIIWTGYVQYENSTTVFSIESPSALATAPPAEVRSAIRHAKSIGLNVTLCPVIDPSWDVPSNGRSIDAPNPVSRLKIGTGYSEADWTAFFASYEAFIMPYVGAAAAEGGVALFEVASELDIAFTARAAQWRALTARVRAALPPGTPLTIAANIDTAPSITWWDALDYIGVDAYGGLGAPLPLGVAPAVADLVAAWAPAIAGLATLSAATGGKPVLVTEVGFQSRPSCHVRPWGTVTRDTDDDSAWLEDHDMACQANAYEALLRALTPQPWFAGVYWWLWRSDPTQGGTGDSDFTPHGKPAEGVLRRWYGNFSASEAGEEAEAGAQQQQQRQQPWDPLGDGRAAIVSALAAQHARNAAETTATTTSLAAAPAKSFARRSYNGFVFGGPDEWSYPLARYDSSAAAASLAAMVAQTGADSVEVIAQWYYDNVTSTAVYPVTDYTSPLATSTDEELLAVLALAKSRGLKTILTPMLDPNWMLPAQQWCRDSSAPQCFWRGQLGQLWPYAPDESLCASGSGGEWGAWHDAYAQFVLHYARLAAAAGVDAFLVSHELQEATGKCPTRWRQLLAAVRAAYPLGAVSAALTMDILQPAVRAASPWTDALAFVGVDCYQQLGGGDPWAPLQHPPLPWQDIALPDLVNVSLASMPAFAAAAAALGKKIVCTEVGWPSRPWAWATWGGTTRLDQEDCSVWDQCVGLQAQALAYQAFLQSYYTQDWFDGVLFWTWRADPTAGGHSDDGFTPTGKPAAAAVQQFWAAMA